MLLKAWAWTVSDFSRLPFPSIFTPSPVFLITRAASRASGVTVVPFSKRFSFSMLTAMISFLNLLVNPRFGMRRCSGIWPPSKPGRTPPPERAFCPLWPRPAVLPMPEPIPWPLRVGFVLAPGAGFSSCSFTCPTSSGFLDFKQVRDLIDHSPDLGGVFLDYGTVRPGQAQRAHGNALAFRAPDQAFDQGYLQLGHCLPS
ncbi:hypothetical protein PTH_0339 [Pelotomaculum thermopropionicum SI]|uniref:Uncharacterized protein n=1 Tax=Pelotomaculum thermopropionicum (strain DSM 13744 / JCM 10971 / SI) TaxID=370438 RepID=A5D5H2_PELTS|nr:hypothetical protein PTH_0339 [Pelotomaculum thermopropionicum SI]